jgi:anti-sigma factor RsiW
MNKTISASHEPDAPAREREFTTMTNHECPNQLEWLAFCYAAGELTPADSEQFEATLAGDQAAREALARAVELTQVVAAAERHVSHVVAPAVAAHRGWNSRLAWMAVGGLAALLLAFLFSGVVESDWRSMHASRQRHLALAWNETKTQIADVRQAGLWPAVDLMSDSDGDPVDGWTASDELAVAETPSWLTAAVLGRAEGTDPTSDSF